MRRRTLLTSAGAAAALVGMGGCGVRLTDPLIHGSPMAPYSPPPPTPYPGSTAVATLEREAWVALLSAAAAPGADAASLGKLAAVRGSHVAVLADPEPIWRRPSATSGPPPAAPPAATKEAGAAAALAALVALRDGARDTSLGSEGLDAVLWGSLAVSADQARQWLSVPVGAVAPAAPGRVVAVMDDAAALNLLIGRYHEAVYGFSSLLGFLPRGDTQRSTVTTLLTAARTRRDALMAYDRAASATPTPGAGAYSVPPTTPDRMAAVAGAMLSAITGAAGVWLASARTLERRDQALKELTYAASAGLPIGTGLAEWPGWPD